MRNPTQNKPKTAAKSRRKVIKMAGVVTKQERDYIKKQAKKMTETDPTLVIQWHGDVLDAVILAAAGNQIPAPPNAVAPVRPNFVNINSTECDQFDYFTTICGNFNFEIFILLLETLKRVFKTICETWVEEDLGV